MCACGHGYVCMWTWISEHVNMDMCAHGHVRMWTWISVHVDMDMCACAHGYVCMCTWISVHVDMDTCACAHGHVRMWTWIRVHVHMDTCACGHGYCPVITDGKVTSTLMSMCSRSGASVYICQKWSCEVFCFENLHFNIPQFLQCLGCVH